MKESKKKLYKNTRVCNGSCRPYSKTQHASDSGLALRNSFPNKGMSRCSRHCDRCSQFTVYQYVIYPAFLNDLNLPGIVDTS